MLPARLKTLILLAVLTALLLFVGQLVGGYSGLAIAGVVVVLMNIFSLYFSDKIVLKMYKAKPADRSGRLYKSVVRLSKKAGLPIPKVYILSQEQPNAFATGRSPKHAAVAATQGLLDLLSDDELDGVIAHELAHIKHYDTLLQTIAATIAGIISYVATMAQWAAIFGGFSRDGDGGDNLVSLLVLIIVTPFVATLLQLALSRQREYMADNRAAQITHKPLALASALEKISLGSSSIPMHGGNQATSSMFIANPFSRMHFSSLFSTHPPIQKRIEKLHLIKF